MSEDLTPEADPSCSGAEQDMLWMERVKNGDQEAFQLLIETHQSRIVGTVAKMLGDDTDSEDIAQQVFIRVWNSADRYFQMPDPNSPSPAATMMDGELQAAIQRAIDSLPEAQRMAIILRRYEELSYEEIAEVLKLSVPAVKSILFRARADLRERLQKYLDE